MLYLLNVVTFRTSGKVIGYQFKVGSAEYKKYQKRMSNLVLLVTLLIVALLCILIVLQFSTVAHKHSSGSTQTLVIGGILTLLVGFWCLYNFVLVYGQKNRSKSSGRHKDDSWLV